MRQGRQAYAWDEFDQELEWNEARRQQRSISEIRLPAPASSRSAIEPLAETGGGPRLSDELRAQLWQLVHDFLLSPPRPVDPWTGGVSGLPAVRRVWSSPPISGIPELIPHDVTELLDRWFALVEPPDVYAFVESVLANLEPSKQSSFATACNAVLERERADQRILFRKVVPITSKADLATLTRALGACRTAGLAATEVEQSLLDAVDRLAQKPDPDRRGAIHEAVRAVEAAVFALTGERHLRLDDALEDLDAKGLIDPALKSAYGGLFAYADRHQTTFDDARVIVVMCAGFIAHLAAKMS